MNRLAEATAFIFDCDGTLLNSLEAWDEAEHDLFAQTGPLSQEQDDEIHSSALEHAAEIFHTKYGVGESAEAVFNHLEGHLLPFYRDVVEPMPGACEFVRSVYEAGKPCVVLSSSPRRYLEAGLRRVGILDCFTDLITPDEVGVSKQDPRIYEYALEVLGTKKENTWAVDDAPYAVQVMSQFGLKTIGVAAGCSEERKAQLLSHANLVVETLCELPLL